MKKPIVTLFDIPICNVTLQEAAEMILECSRKEGTTQVFFVNAHCVNVARRDTEYLRILQNADLVFGDGAGIQWASRVLGTPLIDNVNGTDLYPWLCQLSQEHKCCFFLLGAEPGVAEKMIEASLSVYPGMIFAGYQHGYYQEQEEMNVLEFIRNSHPDILFVALGVPKQEKWIEEHASVTGAKVCVGVGGLFRFYSKQIPRAPLWMRRMGVEWFHRLCKEPRRLWKRYLLGNLIFILRTYYYKWVKR